MTNQVTMTKVKDCKHSVPFETENPEAPVRTIYIKRSWLGSRTQVIQTWDETQVAFQVNN